MDSVSSRLSALFFDSLALACHRPPPAAARTRSWAWQRASHDNPPFPHPHPRITQHREQRQSQLQAGVQGYPSTLISLSFSPAQHKRPQNSPHTTSGQMCAGLSSGSAVKGCTRSASPTSSSRCSSLAPAESGVDGCRRSGSLRSSSRGVDGVAERMTGSSERWEAIVALDRRGNCFGVAAVAWRGTQAGLACSLEGVREGVAGTKGSSR